MIIAYDIQGCNTPGECTPWVLRDELRADALFVHSDVVGVTATTDRPAGQEIEVEYSGPITAGQQTAAVAVVAAHDAATLADLGDEIVTMDPVVVAPNPGAGWSPVPGYVWHVADGRKVYGKLALTVTINGAPGGLEMAFTAARPPGGSLEVSYAGDRHGPISGFGARLETSGETIRISMKRNGSHEIFAGVTGTISRVALS